MSGLINAYKTAAMRALEDSQKMKVLIKIQFEVLFTYEQTTPVQKFIHDSGVSVESQEFGRHCKMIVTCVRSRELETINLLEDLKQRSGITTFSKIILG